MRLNGNVQVLCYNSEICERLGLEVTQGGVRRPDVAALDDRTFAEPVAAGASTLRLRRATADLVATLEVTQDVGTLPFLQFHHNPARDATLLCVEPTSHDRRPRDELLAGQVAWVGQRSRDFSLDLRFDVSRTARS